MGSGAVLGPDVTAIGGDGKRKWDGFKTLSLLQDIGVSERPPETKHIRPLRSIALDCSPRYTERPRSHAVRLRFPRDTSKPLDGPTSERRAATPAARHEIGVIADEVPHSYLAHTSPSVPQARTPVSVGHHARPCSRRPTRRCASHRRCLRPTPSKAAALKPNRGGELNDRRLRRHTRHSTAGPWPRNGCS